MPQHRLSSPTPGKALHSRVNCPDHPGRAQATQGMTMIIVVLFTLLLLAGILAATLQLGLSSRQNTADQASTLVAQYAAESNISAVRSRFRDYQNLLTTNWTDASGSTVTNLQMPSGTQLPAVENDAKAFCGQSGVSNPWTPTSDFAAPREAGDADVFPLAVQCIATTAPTANSYSIMADAVKMVAYAQLPASERPALNATRADLQIWWLNNLNNVTVGNAKYDIRPLRAVKLTDRRFRFYLGAVNVTVKGNAGGGERYLTASRTNNGDWWFEITVPNPFDNVLFINQWLSDDGGFYNDTIDGDFFTNQKVRMLFNVNKAVFKGKVRSVGCTTFPSTTAQVGTDCTKADGAGFYGGLSSLIKPSVTAVSGGVDAINADLKDKMVKQGTTFTATGLKDVSFTESYQPLPINSTDQEADAIKSGIVLALGETGVELAAGDESGDPLSNYDGDKSMWKEPIPVYQYIRINKAASTGYDSKWLEVDKSTYDSWPISQRGTSTSNNKTYYLIHPEIKERSREFRFGSDKILYKKQSNGWVSTGIAFNGVVHSKYDTTVSGPIRKDISTTSDVSKMPPALTSFAKINVTSNQKITLDTDLTMSNTPCDNSNSQKGCPKTGSLEPNNALVLFTPYKDIVMSKMTQSDATYHAAIMASQGSFNVENYSTRRVQGSRHIIGSVVENRYGLNGVASLSNGNVTFSNGYGDDFSFDNRLRKDILPSSPIVQIWGGADALNTQKRLGNLTWKQAAVGDY
jgi:Tfp pilus assembly protein PilX